MNTKKRDYVMIVKEVTLDRVGRKIMFLFDAAKFSVGEVHRYDVKRVQVIKGQYRFKVNDQSCIKQVIVEDL